MNYFKMGKLKKNPLVIILLTLCVLGLFAQGKLMIKTGFEKNRAPEVSGDSHLFTGNEIPSLFQSCKEKVIFQEPFNYPDGELPSSWWSEGNAAKIKDGRLFIDADSVGYRAGTVWLDRELSGNIRIEYDVHVVSSSDSANNINCFVLYSDPGEKSLRESQNQRENGSYGSYHKLNGYIFTFLANGNPTNARIRFRDNPGFNLLAEDFGFECKSGVTYRIKIEKRGNKFRYWVNEEMLLEKVDNPYNEVHQTGHFGFRTWHTALWWDNLVITQLN